MDKKTILIIEDEPALVEMYTKKFESAGFIVSVTTDGESGIEKALQDKPSAVLIDLFIPKKDGMTVLEELRPRLPDTKLIIATNLDQPGKENEAVEKGANGYIIKAKYLPSEIVKVVESMLD